MAHSLFLRKQSRILPLLFCLLVFLGACSSPQSNSVPELPLQETEADSLTEYRLTYENGSYGWEIGEKPLRWNEEEQVYTPGGEPIPAVSVLESTKEMYGELPNLLEQAKKKEQTPLGILQWGSAYLLVQNPDGSRWLMKASQKHPPSQVESRTDQPMRYEEFIEAAVRFCTRSGSDGSDRIGGTRLLFEEDSSS